LLFNLVVDALAYMLESVRSKGWILVLVPRLVEGGGLTHLQYADDIVLMIQNNDESILNLKLLVYCFENMSGMKINYHKSEVPVFGGDDQFK
jgi:hypothetical protein